MFTMMVQRFYHVADGSEALVLFLVSFFPNHTRRLPPAGILLDLHAVKVRFDIIQGPSKCLFVALKLWLTLAKPP